MHLHQFIRIVEINFIEYQYGFDLIGFCSDQKTIDKGREVGGVFRVIIKKTWSILAAMMWICLERLTDFLTI